MSDLVESRWFLFLRKSATKLMLGVYFGILFLTAIITAIGIKVSVPDMSTFDTAHSTCAPPILIVVSLMQACFFFLSLIFLVWKLYPVKDTFAFKWELIATLSVGLPFFVLSLVLSLAVNLAKVVPSGIWSIIVYLVCNCASFGIPLYHIIKTRNHVRVADSGSFVSMESVPNSNAASTADFLVLILDTPALLHGLQEFMVANWSVENLLFLIEVRTFHGLRGTPEEVMAEAKKIYDMFLAPNAMFELNIDAEDQERIMEEINGGRYSPDIFEDVRVKIFSVIKHDTLPRWRMTKEFEHTWEQHLEKGSKRSSMISSKDGK